MNAVAQGAANDPAGTINSVANLVESLGATELTLLAGFGLGIFGVAVYFFHREGARLKFVVFLCLFALVAVVLTFVLVKRRDAVPPVGVPGTSITEKSKKVSTELPPPPVIGSSSDSDPPAPPTPTPAEVLGKISDGLRRWAEENLGERPDLSPRFERDYPECVAELRERTSNEGVLIGADACARQLGEHRRRYVIPLFAERARYADALESQHNIIIRHKLTPDAQERLNYIVRESRNFYRYDGAANLEFSRAGQRSKGDLRLCETNGCRAGD